MAVSEHTETQAVPAEQVTCFESGNEMAATAAAQINYHIMGYFPITPSTEVAQYLDQMKARGQHDIQLIAADGEHGSAGICYGAAMAGARVINATSSQGFLYMLEQLPTQSGTRFPMVLNLVTRAVSGPLDIRGDHSDLYYGLNTGWVILTASTPQAVYDMNIMALRIAEHSEVRLPVIVAYDGFFTSHQKRKVQYFKENEVVQHFVGPNPNPNYPNISDPAHPVTIGAHMGGDDLLNNHYQLSLALDRAGIVYDEIAREYAALSGREHKVLDLYRMDDAEVAVFLLNSAGESAKDTVDALRAKGIKAGLVRPNLIRPFPAEQLRQALKNVKALLVGERADSYGAQGGNLTHEIRSALQVDPDNQTIILSRIFGLGGKDFYADDAEAFFQLAIDAAEKGYAEKPFDYHGYYPGEAKYALVPVREPQHGDAYKSGLIQVAPDEDGRLKVKLPPLRQLTAKPHRLAPGHGACPGCGALSALELFFKGIEGDMVVLFQTGCAYVVTASYPYTSHNQTFVHNLFQNGAATLAGMVDAFYELKRRGEIQISDDVTFVMVSGDGGMDIGMGATVGAALRNHKMIILEYDNEGYMNTGSQLSYSTPMGHMTSTSGVGKTQKGKKGHHKDTAQILAACNIPYVFTGAESHPQDLLQKAAKAQWYANNVGTAYGKLLCACPLNWKTPDHSGHDLVKAAVDSCFFPLYEIEEGITSITYNPELKGKRIPAVEWLKGMGKTKHLLQDEELLRTFETEIERRWSRLKLRHENSLL
ncbi:thiamine pyrophosphate-dependent enzyme [Paenibacillus sp. NFR01]|uniref:thiamine pyrophosphate-dependent enzyme n=1 Tax=Paenibacillus sp. NFR01 TaxID=1566279 RepID=UPI0008AAD32F|nr:thiamine pyrophosphate-dependent enzyme [Paenibacillus sp. NFR01]SET26466.1 pyruvate ferredoxin oxidoreductase alpha subunit [Paenibacillus sp. NFR01]